MKYVVFKRVARQIIARQILSIHNKLTNDRRNGGVHFSHGLVPVTSGTLGAISVYAGIVDALNWVDDK